MSSPPPKKSLPTIQMERILMDQVIRRIPLSVLIRQIPKAVQKRQKPLLIQSTINPRKITTSLPSTNGIIQRTTGDKRRVQLLIQVTITVKISEDTRPFTSKLVAYDGQARNVQDFINEVATELWESYYVAIPEMGNIDKLDVRMFTLDNRPVKYDYASNRMNALDFKDISINIFSNIVPITPTDENCVKTVLRTLYPKISSQKNDPIGKLGNEDGVSTTDILNFCQRYNIRMIAYTIRKEVIAKYNPPTPDHKYKSLYFISNNGHIHLLKNKFLEEHPKPNNYVNLTEQQLEETLISTINQGYIPADIRYSLGLSSFIHNKIHYFQNDEFNDSIQILKSFGLEDKITHSTRLHSVISILEKAYNSPNLNSFLPIHHIKAPFLYSRERDPKRQIQTIDKNKAYASILQSLEYLLVVDYKYEHALTKLYNDFSIVQTNALYIAKPDFPNILMPYQDIYSGSHILYCQGKIPFKILEVLPATRQLNIYENIITDLFNLAPEQLVKKAVVKYIGTFQSEPTVKQSLELNYVEGTERNLNIEAITLKDKTFEIHERQFVSNIYNRKPIAIQIKDRMSQILYEEMIKQNIKSEDVLQINTDSITYYSDTQPILDPKPSQPLHGWKEAEYKLKKGNTFINQQPFETFKIKEYNKNTLITGYAGNGKSYYIQNNLKLENYVILSNKHSAITQHRNKGLNARVIQTYEFNGEVPSEQHIIIEEVGLLTSNQWHILYKCFLLKKKITAFGDFKQLLPVNEGNSPSQDFLNLFFHTQQQQLTNYRNNFTIEYYDSLINSRDSAFLKQEILKHSTKTPEEADVIIAYTNKTVDKYNQYMLNYLNKTLDDDVPMVVKTNIYKDQNVYNNFVMTTTELKQTLNKPFDFKKIATNKEPDFKPAYARTLYNIQGDEVRSYYIAPEDIHWFTSPREAYTLISRLKQE